MGKIRTFINYISASYFVNFFNSLKKQIKIVLAVKFVYSHSIDRKTIFNSLMMTVYMVRTQGQSLQSTKESVLNDTPVIKTLGASYHIVFPGSSQDDSLFFSPGEEY